MKYEVSNYKITTFIPASHLEQLLDALREVVPNHIGNYNNCFTWYPVKSSWTSLEGAEPYIGAPGEISVADEIKVQFLCGEEKLKAAVDAIMRVHPYEEPVADIMPVILGKDILI